MTLLIIPSLAPNGEYRILTHRYQFHGGGSAEAIQTLFPTIVDTDYILMDRLGSTYPLETEDYEVFWQAAQDPFEYEKLYDDNGFILLRREEP